MPIWDQVQYSLTNLFPARYRIAGVAAFVVTGYTGLIGGLLGEVSSLPNSSPSTIRRRSETVRTSG
ncbi:MAG TPA: hypothetical protein VN408_01610 [Actinoplanes sp.]|nr:hypothetical protein [Actinoplanes sp.]